MHSCVGVALACSYIAMAEIMAASFLTPELSWYVGGNLRLFSLEVVALAYSYATRP